MLHIVLTPMWLSCFPDGQSAPSLISFRVLLHEANVLRYIYRFFLFALWWYSVYHDAGKRGESTLNAKVCARRSTMQRSDVQHYYLDVRHWTHALCQPLAIEDYVVQPV